MELTTSISGEKAVIMGIFKTSISEDDIAYSMHEIVNLAESALIKVCGLMSQRRDKIEAATYIGKGKVDEVKMLCEQEGADTLIVNTELSGAQMMNLGEQIGVKVVDRTTLILDIFALRAKSRIAKLQVELAQYKYRLPRLKGFGSSMSNTGAGIGTRGPGEQKLELDRRRINEKIHDLEERLKLANKKRLVTKQNRKRGEVKSVALLGYTNAGKSSLMNLFIEKYPSEGEEKQVFVKDMLFATLDTYHRKICLENGRDFVLSDTVGFVSDLPHELVKAFHSTLEEVLDANLIIHLVDASNENYEKQMRATIQTLEKLGADMKNVLTVYNKSDKLLENIELQEDALLISTLSEEGFDALKTRIENTLFGAYVKAKIVVPFSEGKLLQEIMDASTVLSIEYKEDGTHVEAKLGADYYKSLNELGVASKK